MLTEQNFRRQTGIYNPEEYGSTRITIIGAGAIGSFTALSLAKMGIKNFTVFDHDVIEDHNLPNQFYMLRDVNVHKTIALREMIHEFTGYDILHLDKFTRDSDIDGDIVLAVTDSMASRKLVWEKAKVEERVTTFIDARMGGELLKIYTVDPHSPVDQGFYESYFHDDASAARMKCTERSIIYNVLVVAGLISNQVKKCLKEEEIKREIIFDLKALHLYSQQ